MTMRRALLSLGLVFLLLLGATVPRTAHADTVTTADVVGYVQNTWGIASDGSDAITYFSSALGQQYNGIPYSDYITMLVVSARVGTQLDNHDYYGAAYSLSGYAGSQVLNVALENVDADGLFGVASFSADAIQFSLDLFIQAVAQKTFNEQCKFYFIARSQYNLADTARPEAAHQHSFRTKPALLWMAKSSC